MDYLVKDEVMGHTECLSEISGVLSRMVESLGDHLY